MVREETIEIIKSIPGGPALVAWFGERFSFHDAEMRSLVLNRDGSSRLEVVADPWEQQPTVVTFHLSDCIDVDIRGFSQQNVMGELHLRHAGEPHHEPFELGVGLVPGKYEFEFEPIFGAYGTLRCTVNKIELAKMRV